MLPYGTGICCYAAIYILNLLLLLSIPFFYLKKNLVLINRRNGPRYQRALAKCAFFFLNRGNTGGINFSKNFCLMCVFMYVLFYINPCQDRFYRFLENLWFDDLCPE